MKIKICHVQSVWTLTTIKGKTRPMKKKLSQFTDPAIMYAAGRVVCVNNSVVKMLVTPPRKKKKQLKKSVCLLKKYLKITNFQELPGPKPKLRMKANTQIMLKYGNTGLTS